MMEVVWTATALETFFRVVDYLSDNKSQHSYKKPINFLTFENVKSIRKALELIEMF